MTISKYYIRGILIPAGIMLVFMIIYLVFMYKDYVSAWYTADGAIIISIIQALIFSCMICVLSLSIFLTKNNFFKKSLLLSAFAWFILPYGLIVFTWIQDIRWSLRFDLDYTEAYIYNLILTLPFIIGLGLTFIQYKNNYRQQQV